MKFLSYVVVLVCSLVSIGCGNILPPVALTPAFWKSTAPTVGVGMTRLPRGASFQTTGQSLLEGAVTEAIASDLNDHLNNLDLSKFDRILEIFKGGLAQHDFKVSEIKAPVDVTQLPDFDAPKGAIPYALKDFRSLKEKFGVDRLLLIELHQVGTIRPYRYGVIPMGPPITFCIASGSLINLADNRILWHLRESQSGSVAEPWDQPPNFANLTDALTEKMHGVSTSLLRDFFALAPSQPGKNWTDLDSRSAFVLGPVPESAAGFALGKDIAGAEASCTGAGLVWQKLAADGFSCSGAPVDLGVPVTVKLTACAGVVCEVAVNANSDGAPWSVLVQRYVKFSRFLEGKYGDQHERATDPLDDCTDEIKSCFSAGRARTSATWRWSNNQSVSLVLDGGSHGSVASLGLVYGGVPRPLLNFTL